jgi:hypothetical protein
MSVQTGNRLPLSLLASRAIAESRLAARAVPRLLRHVAPILAWAVASVVLGLAVGLAAVILPPLGAFGIVAVAGVVLLWVMPDLPLVWPRLIRKTFFVMLITDLSVPYYYTVQFAGLPWISARRLATFALIVPFLLAIAASSDVRRQITERLRGSPLIVVCAVGYLVMATVSILTSALPTESISLLTDALLSWYVPMFAMIYIARDNDDVIFILKIICVCAIFNTMIGFIDFRLQHRVLTDIFPRGMLSTLIENNPNLQVLLPSPGDFRNGLYRASSVFITPLSFGEFEIVAIPIALFFALHRNSLLEKTIGWIVVFGGIFGIFFSGSRGGWVGVIASIAVFVAAWSIRKAMNSKASLAPAISAMVGGIAFAVVMGLIIVWPKAHNIVLGGGAEAGSTDARYAQWHAAIPIIETNPITGHGFALGGYLIHSSIDSYIISLLLETGIPGFVFFAGMLLLPVWYGLRSYLSDMSESGALSGALACSFIAFSANRLVLSQRENHMLIFSLLAIVVVLNYERARKRATKPASSRQPEKTFYRREGSWPARA